MRNCGDVKPFYIPQSWKKFIGFDPASSWCHCSNCPLKVKTVTPRSLKFFPVFTKKGRTLVCSGFPCCPSAQRNFSDHGNDVVTVHSAMPIIILEVLQMSEGSCCVLFITQGQNVVKSSFRLYPPTCTARSRHVSLVPWCKCSGNLQVLLWQFHLWNSASQSPVQPLPALLVGKS